MEQKKIENIIVTSALAMAASTLLPIAKTTLRPVVITGMQSALGLLNIAKSTFQLAREEMEDIIAEAQFERMKKQLDKEIFTVNPEEGKSEIGQSKPTEQH